jgi:hypothetical protein
MFAIPLCQGRKATDIHAEIVMLRECNAQACQLPPLAERRSGAVSSTSGSEARASIRKRSAVPWRRSHALSRQSEHGDYPSRPAATRTEAAAAAVRLITVVYTTVDFYRENGIGALPGTEFWLRSVAGHPSTVYPGQRWTFWQYTGTGLVPGIHGPVDINVFAGSVVDWKRWRK